MLFGIALALQCLLPVHGFRAGGRKLTVTAAVSGHGHPASLRCILASGFDLKGGCKYPEAMQPVPNCENAAFNQACYQDDRGDRVQGYSRDIRSNNDYSSLVRSVTEAEGGGFGVSVSASFSYMKRSQVSEKSLAFFIGASSITQTRTILRPVAMNLTSPAKALLRQNPREFISRYGLKYIHGITYGGSFLGSVTLNSRETTDASDVQAFASLSVTKGLFSASGSTEFQRKLSQGNLDVAVYIDAKWGGGFVSKDFENPETLHNMFRQWDGTVRQNPVPLTVTTRNWIDSADVQEIVNSMPPADQALFNSPDITFTIQREISEENAKVSLIDNSIRQALTWKETRWNGLARSCLSVLSKDVSAQLIRISSLNDARVVVIQEKWLARDYTWFESPRLEDRYRNCVAGIKPTPAPTPAPTPGPPPRDFTIRLKVQPQSCLNSWGGRLVAREKIKLGFRCSANDNERFVYSSDYTIRLKAKPELCLNANTGKLKEGDDIQLWRCSAARNEQFVFFNDNTIRLKSKTNLCLNVRTGYLEGGKQIQLYRCHDELPGGAPGELWVHRA